ncbi:tRNAHis guanylyltransferase [Eremomyces bilateralis CBS 781.70]|uniref:tRNA(His) guanylyltransferase n=1 Tax=Eremomyces bilateralis CBS 781.70 TaxID=1392243 RepID=A0A6G1FZR4_9PEZI|nr:tRNAHis guanylyltransferase [Eremomyces bilateralis CBS 781.70]KAF1811347.1 tRNAHis guanylyltransferase [Eremomyces bilateralis CBS 781.70]
MANSKYEYVKTFEQPDNLLSRTWIVIRIDGRGFTKLCSRYGFEKPNDRRAIDLMNSAAQCVMKDIPDLLLAYGVSDEFSFLFHKDCTLFQRRSNKLVSTIVSTFTGYYVHLWTNFFPDKPLIPPLPSFDGRAVLYPDVTSLRDYFSWRQADCHINNLYNTSFWSLIQKAGLDARAAEKRLSGTVSKDKHEILYAECDGMNYNREPDVFKKGSVLYRSFELESRHALLGSSETSAPETPTPQSKTVAEKDRKRRLKATVAIEHIDIIQEDFWNQRPWILSGKTGRLPDDNAKEKS